MQDLYSVQGIQNPPGPFPVPRTTGEEILMDFTDMGEWVRGKRYLLVIIDVYSGWPEVYPTAKENAAAVIKALINYYIPNHGFPRRIRSDNGTHFKNKHLEQVEQQLSLGKRSCRR